MSQTLPPLINQEVQSCEVAALSRRNLVEKAAQADCSGVQISLQTTYIIIVAIRFSSY